MDYDIRTGDIVKTDAVTRGISETGIFQNFDPDGDPNDEIRLCYVMFHRIDDGSDMLCCIIAENITHNLSAEMRDNNFHECIKKLQIL